MEPLGDRVVAVSSRYLGPEAKRFLERQCKHLSGVSLDSLDPRALPDLAWWVGVSGKLVMSEDKATELKQKLIALAR